jgi:hypothetical protein
MTKPASQNALQLARGAIWTDLVDPNFGPEYAGLANAYLERAGELRLGRPWLGHAIDAGCPSYSLVRRTAPPSAAAIW